MRSVNLVVLALAASKAMGAPLALSNPQGTQSLDARAELEYRAYLDERELNERGFHGACVSR
jgi:hypothetical protein